jgi:chromosome segregation ATPase
LQFTDADLAEQFKLLIAIRDQMTGTHDLVRRIRSLREQLEAKVKANTSLAEQAKAINDKLYRIEERLSQYRAKATQDLTNYPVGIDDKLVVLQRFVSQADAPPTKQHGDLLKDLSERIEKQRAALEEVIRTDWAALNQQR